MSSRLDAVYRSILITKFFSKGWGKPENLRRLFEFRKVVANRDECFKLVERDYPVTITKEQNLSDCKLLEGYFTTPLERYLPGIVPQVAQKAHFQALLPLHWPDPHCKPVCLHLAGTGDHFFWRRRNLMVKPLLKEASIGGIILENPFYGLRKPTDQVRSSLHNVSDIFVMGGCLILESLVLFHWCERNGLGPLGVTGLSMGGHMASLAATNWPKPLVLVPCLSWSTASAVFLQGVMSHSINWDLLEDQYMSDGVYREKLSKMVTIVDEAFLAGKKFARTYSQTVEKELKAQTTHTEKDLNIPLDLFKGISVDKIDKTYVIDTETDKMDVKDVNLNTVSNKVHDAPSSFEQIENLEEELKKLLEEKKISQDLFNKLTSNEKFELNPHDIDNINNLTKSKLKDMLLRCKVADVRNDFKEVPASESKQKITTDPSTDSDSKTGIKEIHPQTLTSTLEKDNSAGSLQLKATTTTALAMSTEEQKLPELKKVRKSLWNVSEISDLWMHLPFLKSSGKKIDITKIHWRDREALQFMRGIMDECTHLSNFSVPYDTSLIIAVCAKHDAYVPRVDVGALEEIWPGAEVRYVDAGHISAYILHQSVFRSCIIEAFERSKKKWKDGKHVNC